MLLCCSTPRYLLKMLNNIFTKYSPLSFHKKRSDDLYISSLYTRMSSPMPELRVSDWNDDQ